jgi:DNA polymerase IV
MRKIIHVDMDAFYASVEQRENPSLIGRPVIIGGDPNKRGVVATCSYEARGYGVHSGMSSFQALKRCPQGIFVPPNFTLYKEISEEIRKIFDSFTDLVEPLALDEAYLDVTENKQNEKSAVILAKRIRQAIFDKTKLTASAGVSYNKFLAKIASDLDKPNGLSIILPHEAEHFLESLKIEKFYGIGKVTTVKMHEMGIQNGRDLKKHSFDFLKKSFGKMGEFYYYIVRGHDFRSVNPKRVRKSFGKEITFPFDISDQAILLKKLNVLSIKIADGMSKHSLAARTLTVKVKTKDFKVSTKSYTVLFVLKESGDIFQLARDLFLNIFTPGMQVRLLGVSLSKLSGYQEGREQPFQMELPFKEFSTF